MAQTVRTTLVLVVAVLGCSGGNDRQGSAAAPSGQAGTNAFVAGGGVGIPAAGAAAMQAAGAAPGTTGSGGGAGMSAAMPGGTAGSAGTGEPGAGTGSNAGAAGEAGSAGQDAEPATLADDQTLIPDASWTCGMADGIPGPLGAEAIFEIDFEVGEVHDLGRTQYGDRLQIDVTGGTVAGPKLQAAVKDRGLDYQLTLDNGVIELEQIHVLTSGSASVYMRNCGVAPGPGNVRVVLDFEAPNGSAVAWLNTGSYIGTREFDAASKTLHMTVYEVTAAADPANAVRVVEPDGAVDQSWDCVQASGTRGDVVYMESVGIGAGSIAVGASKRGTRNIIPITGGTTTGRIAGGVLSGGADYQLISGSVFELDARYTLQTDDGELIIVRNCGPVGALVPVFETRADGAYAWVNENAFLSSDPGISVGAVNLTIYEKR